MATNTELRRIANRLRLDVVETVHKTGDGHPGPCMSVAEIIALLYFEQMTLRPDEPRWPDRDRFILSKGHACPILYAALARKGYFPLEELPKLRTLEGMLQGHPDSNKTPGIDTVSGSLGNGVAIGLGMALGCRMQGIDNYVFVVVGDGEQQEGVVWEAAMSAVKHKAGGLIVLSDGNNNQSGGKVTDLTSLYPIAPKWEAFQWHVQSVDGHDVAEIYEAVCHALEHKGKPSMIVLNTVKGDGWSASAGKVGSHNRTVSPEELKEALKEMEAALKEVGK